MSQDWCDKIAFMFGWGVSGVCFRDLDHSGFYFLADKKDHLIITHDHDS